ncbi:hypothetical protein BRC87_06000 [Halobacteriales archaeon QS_4_66_20]|nr:MAG: hypothetical protein BRC87_06000 [Halobacteriales archaeon QS_4_66_20]
MIRARSLLVAVVAGHVVLSGVHGMAHATIPVAVPGWQYGYAAVVIFVAPVAGAALVVRNRPVLGGWLLVVSGLAALGFEGLAHFVVSNSDHVSAVESGRALFGSTAVLTTAGNALLLVAAAWFLQRGDGERDATTGGARLETATE